MGSNGGPASAMQGFREAEDAWESCTIRKRKKDGRVKVVWDDGSTAVLQEDQIREKPQRPKKPLKEALRHRLPPHKFVMAPMVGGSELPFRMLARRYGVQTCYTPMIYSGPFASDASYRAAPENGFHTCEGDRPLVAHFCGNDPQVLLKAAKHVAHQVDAIDLNLGCPQRIAHSGHFGSYLLDEPDRELVCSIIRTLADGLPIPVFCKIRLLDDLEATLKMVRQFEAAGASLIAVHARYRGTATRRRDGPAHLEQVAAIKKVVKVPVLSNGNVRTWEDVMNNLETTGADGVMSAEGMLDDPCLYANARQAADSPELEEVQKKLRIVAKLEKRAAAGEELTEKQQAKIKRKGTLLERQASLSAGPEAPSSGLAKARLYLKEIKKYWIPPLSTIIFHCRRMAKRELTEYQLLEDFVKCTSQAEVEKMLTEAEGYRDNPGSFKFSEEKAKKAREEREKKIYEEECRKKFEARMARKAARMGVAVSELLKPTAVPGGKLHFNSEPTWLQEQTGCGLGDGGQRKRKPGPKTATDSNQIPVGKRHRAK
mmetsp:Transcript_10926/g.27519  ORF Transcript_10926/g.27519 Transcript_10926/m.27519 type:complete len:542 (-) Transcript_10926:63-1688(-)